MRMIRTNARMIGVLFVSAASLSACAHEPELAKCPDPVVVPVPPPPPVVAPPKPYDPRPLAVCQTPYAIVELAPEQKECPLPGPEAARWVPVAAPRVATNHTADGLPPQARRLGKSSPGFCVYEWQSPNALPSADDFARIKGEPDCAAPVGFGEQKAGTAELPAYVWEPLTKTFDSKARGMSDAEWKKLYAARLAKPKVPVRVAVVDSSSTGVATSDLSKHGFAVSRVIGSLFCDDSGSADCEKKVLPYQAFPIVGPRKLDFVKGGYASASHHLFDALSSTLDQWDSSKEHLVINLSLGWDPIKVGPKHLVLNRIVDLLERASCRGALIVASAGNLTGSEGPMIPASLESQKAPDAARCNALGEKAVGLAAQKPAKGVSSAYAPLIHAVGSVDARDQKMTTRREWGQPRMAAYGLSVTAGGSKTLKYTPPISGTSISTAIVSGVAASVWSARPELTSEQVMSLVYQGGAELSGDTIRTRIETEFCVGHPFGPCNEWKVRRANLCGALSKALPQDKLACNDGKEIALPTLPKDYAPPAPQPYAVLKPCLLTNCGVPVGPRRTQLSDGPLPQPGMPSCPTCTLTKNFWDIYTLLWGFPDSIPQNMLWNIVRTYSANWNGNSYWVATPTVENAFYSYWMQVPNDTAYAALDWYFNLGPFSIALDTTPLNVN